MKTPINNTPAQVRLPLLLGLAVAAGIFIGATVSSGNKNVQKIAQGYQKFREILTYIDENYVDSVNTEELVDYSIEKMLEKLDPHTSYIPANEVAEANRQLEGDFDGIGIEFSIFRDTVWVVSTVSGGPAESVGLQSGDKIIKVEGEVICGARAKPDNAKVYKWLRGRKGSRVRVSVRRAGVKGMLDYTLTRDKIPSYSLDAKFMIDRQTGFIRLSRFSATTYQEFKEALQDLKQQGAKRLVLDLRDNPGGYMDKAVSIVDELIGGDGKIVYTDGKGTKFDSEQKAKVQGIFERGALIVLIDEGSASASEIVAGALQDHDRALVVGRRSFGKGLVQLPIDLSDGSELRLTISRYYTPSGRSIQKPYSSYEDDLKHRYESGELFHADSIKLNKKMAYRTTKGRVVYGGGGIMPDVFVPLDTASVAYLNDLYRQNTIREYALQYYQANRKTLDKMKFEDFERNFSISPAMMNELLEMGKLAGVKYDELRFKQSQKSTLVHLKALIAQRVWKNEGYFRIIFQQDEIYQMALKQLERAEKLEKGIF